MFSFLREANLPDGTPGPLSMRRISAAACFVSSIIAGILAMIIIFRFIETNPNTSIDWKAFVPLFIPCIAFLLGGLILLFFTTWSDIKDVVSGIGSLKDKG